MKTIVAAMLLSATGIAGGAAVRTTAPASPQASAAGAATAPVPAPAPARPETGPAAGAPDVAPTLPIAPAGDAGGGAPTTSSALADLGSGVAPASTSADRWDGLDDTTRYLLIMGSADGFAAAGPGAPCFPGENNGTLAKALAKAGFAAQDPDALPEALGKLSAPKDRCATPVRRGYQDRLLKTMPDRHLATYLTGLVRAYSRVRPCPTEAQGYAAAMVTTAILTGADDAQPVDVVAPAIAEGCKGQPAATAAR